MSSRSPASASSLDVASASPLPTLPDELVDRVAGMCARRGGLREWCRSWRGTCRRLADVAWFEKNARGGAPIAIVPSAACPTVQMGLSRAVEAPPRADVRSDSDAPLTSSRAIDPDPDPDAIVREPIVLVKPGTYPENVRVTSSCALLGWGDPADVVIEARELGARVGVRRPRRRRLAVVGRGALPREDGAPRRRAPRHRRRPRRRSARGRRRGRPRRQPHRVREERDAELRRDHRLGETHADARVHARRDHGARRENRAEDDGVRRSTREGRGRSRHGPREGGDGGVAGGGVRRRGRRRGARGR